MHQPSNLPNPSAPPSLAHTWERVFLGALLMLATLPGRTQGLGLITEPLLRDLNLSRSSYADLNLWGTLLGSAFALPAGWLIDRFGLRSTTLVLLLLLAAIVWQLSALTGGAAALFVLILLTRAVGQSALSVASITTVGRITALPRGWAMGVYSVVLSVLFAVAFVVLGGIIRTQGWRAAWLDVAIALVIIAILIAWRLRETGDAPTSGAQETGGSSLSEALRTRIFWVFAGATALFGLVSSGLGLFNEAVLAERGFDQQTFHTFLAVTTLFALLGQLGCGWLSLRFSMPRLLAGAMLLYACGLATLPLLRTLPQLWAFAAIFGVAAGFITVIFFAIWGLAFGRKHLGRIQGAAQMVTVFASAIGPVIFAETQAATGSYASLLFALAPLVLLCGIVAWFTKIPAGSGSPA